MSYRSILVHADILPGSNQRIGAAASLAGRFGCPLTGVSVAVERLPDYTFADAISAIPQDVLDGILKDWVSRVESTRHAARTHFMQIVGTQVEVRWLNINGETKAELVRCARRHDLTILPPDLTPEFGYNPITAAEIGMASGGPVLVLKQAGYRNDFGKKILVAWKETREAARAVRDAWPFLEKADEVHFLRVGPADTSVDLLMQRQLLDHGCRPAHFHTDGDEDSPVEDRIRIHAGRTGADMLVLGLYGHSRLGEAVFGGVSRGIMADPPLPLLISH